jgi:hypothetical protein
MTGRLPLPLYFLSNQQSAIFVRFGQQLFLPLFTCLDNAVLYRRRSDLACDIDVLSRLDDLLEFVRSPPGEEVLKEQSFQVAVDLVGPDAREFLAIDRSEFDVIRGR